MWKKTDQSSCSNKRFFDLYQGNIKFDNFLGFNLEKKSISQGYTFLMLLLQPPNHIP